MDPTIPPNYMQYAMARESGGDPNAQSNTSSASGLFGFTSGTADGVRQSHPELGLTPGWQNDPKQATIGMQAFTQDNAKALVSNGVPVTNTTLYLAHHFGADGALRALQSDVDTPVEKVFGPAVMKANPDLQNKKIGDLTGNPPMPDQTQQPQQQPQQPVMAQAMQPQPSTLFGGNPTPVGGIASIARMLGIGTEPELGRRLQNAGASLIGISDPKGGAALQAAANEPHFNVVNDAFGNRYMVDTRTGLPVNASTNGAPAAAGGVNGGPGAPGAPGAPSAQDLAQTPNALNERSLQNVRNSATKMQSLEDAASKAQSIIDQNTELKGLSQDPGVIQGPGLWNKIKTEASEQSGGSVGGGDVAKMGLFEKGTNALVGANLGAQPGIRFAAPEIKFGQISSASPEFPAATNQQIFDNNIQTAQRVIDVRDIARKHMSQYGVLGPEYSSELEQYQKDHPVFQPTTVQPSGPQGSNPASRPPLSDIFK
jgi:hypothetical protein